MAKEHQIKISSDITGVTKGINEISKGFKKLGDLKIGTNLKGADVKNALKDQREVIVSTQKEISRLSIELTKAMDDKKVKVLRDQIKGLKEDVRSANSVIKDIGVGSRGSTTSGPNNRSQRFSSISEGASGGSSTLGSIGLGAISGILAGVGVFKAIQSVISPVIQAASSRAKLRGLGLSDNEVRVGETSGESFGYGRDESRNQALSLLKSSGSTKELSSYQLLGRSVGLDPEQLIGIGGSLRNSGSNNKQSVQFIKDTLASAVAAGFDKSRSVDVLESIADKTESLAQTRNVNPNAISDLITRTISGSNYFQQNSGRAFSAINGLNSIFTGGGAGTGLAYQALSSLYKGQGKSPVDILYKVKQGLFNSEDAPEEISALFETYLKQYTNNPKIKAGGGLDQLSSDQLKSSSLGLSELGGFSPDTANELIKGFLTKTGADRDKFLAEKFKETQSIDKQTLDFIKSSDNSLLQIQNILENIKLDIGDRVVGLLSDLLKHFGVESNFATSFDATQIRLAGQYKISDLKAFQTLGVNPYANNSSASSNNSQPIASSTNESALTTPSSYPSKYKPLSDEALKKIGLDDKTIERFRKYDPLIVAAAQKYGVDPNTARAVVFNESRFRPDAAAFNKRLNLPGGKGLFQFTGGTGKKYGLKTAADRFDPVKSTDAGVRYLRDLLKRNKGNFSQAIKGYVDPADVGAYTNKVTNDYRKFSAAQNQANIDQYSIFDTISDTVSDLTKTLKGMQEKQKKEPVIKSDISNAAKMAFNQSETITGK
ncbi:MAG TPA: transglycosylase SLT domain-containing protein [Chitinophagales bacterium]|nr:transglycosylase SLT domain-containing protein [Chitinophagales bacterium]HMW93422.1 transglycosylase SLT domain-containing protein [Chitinophagales bacterium]HMZ92955.1 transglycosylase SLT domain-containing protein [Chitinophagales bacterium]HNG25981.1 transglycosylase SLT domain-containing protein [Chitinophagales bacterium]